MAICFCTHFIYTCNWCFLLRGSLVASLAAKWGFLLHNGAVCIKVFETSLQLHNSGSVRELATPPAQLCWKGHVPCARSHLLSYALWTFILEFKLCRYVFAFMGSCIHAFMHTDMQAFMHTYIHINIHIHLCIHTVKHT